MYVHVDKIKTSPVCYWDVVLILLLTSALFVSSTVDLGVEVFAGGRCSIGIVYQPTSCTRCICGLFNFMLCRQTCYPSQDNSQTTDKPTGSRPTGPTVVPILLPTINIRQPIIRLPANLTIFPIPG